MALGVDPPVALDLRRQRRGRPGVHDVGLGGEAARLVALVLGVTRGGIGQGIHRQACSGRRRSGCAKSGSPSASDRVPDRERNPEVALPRDAPVLVEALDPVGVAGLHVGRVPLDLVALGEQRLLVLEDADEPLAGRHELERAVALLVELDDLIGRFGLADEGRARPNPGRLPSSASSSATRFFALLT